MAALWTFLLGNIWRTAALALVAIIGVQTWWLHSAQVEYAELNVTLERERADAAAALAESEAKARKQEQAQAKAFSEIANDYERQLQDTRDSADRVAADLRSGAERLHRRWLACSAAASVSDPTGSPGTVDEGADDRADSAARIIAAAAACDAQVRGLQGLLRAEREGMADTSSE